MTIGESRRARISRLVLPGLRRLVPVLLVAVLVSTIGCATRYHPRAYSGGYSDTRLAPDLFRVSFAGNGFTSAQKAYDFALLRAAELTATHGFTHFALVNENSGHDTYRYYNQFLQSHQTFYKPGTSLLIRAFCSQPEGIFTLAATFVATELRRSYGIGTDPSPAMPVQSRTNSRCNQEAQHQEGAQASDAVIVTGSGFFVSRSGHVLTNAHVVEQCREVRIPPTGVATIVARDDASDLALLKNDMDNQPTHALFRGGRGVQQGSAIVVIGFPLQGFIASGPSVTTGIISSLAGPANDRRLFQMTAPIHHGSSGGPVLDHAGNVVGVATAKLDPFVVARETGDIPQNINFAVSAGITRTFLDAEGIQYEIAPSGTALQTETIATRARQFTVRVECRK